MRLSCKITSVLLMLIVTSLCAQRRHPIYEGGPFKINSKLDRIFYTSLRRHGLRPANLCSDEIFLRRVFLDIIGTLPEPWEVNNFRRNRAGNKRQYLINYLLNRKEFSDYWALKWGDILRIKAEFPINLWPNGVQAYSTWLKMALRDNMPYDKFVKKLLTSSGSNFRVPPVNFYRAIQGTKPETIAQAVALTFMGSRIEKWPSRERKAMIDFFSKVKFKGTAEWKETIVYLDPEHDKPIYTHYPFDRRVTIRAYQDPRVVFADWLINKNNPWFSKNIVNRIWFWLMGRGLIHEPDDILKNSKAVHPEVLAYLEKEFIKSNYNLKHIYKIILNSAVYQQSCIPYRLGEKSIKYFACYPVKRLDAEVLIDAICYLTASQENYQSPIPEPFTFIPEYQRTIKLNDGSITSPFLVMFGRPSRDSGLLSERNNKVSPTQMIHLLNSSHIYNKFKQSWRIRHIVRQGHRRNVNAMIRRLYTLFLSRLPSQAELNIARKYFRQRGIGSNNGAYDLAWALMNSKEFLYNH